MAVHASLKDTDLIFRILNFKEDIHRELLQGEYGMVAETASIDRALAPVTISISRKRHFDHVSLFMADALQRYEVIDAIHISIEHS